MVVTCRRRTTTKSSGVRPMITLPLRSVTSTSSSTSETLTWSPKSPFCGSWAPVRGRIASARAGRSTRWRCAFYSWLVSPLFGRSVVVVLALGLQGAGRAAETGTERKPTPNSSSVEDGLLGSRPASVETAGLGSSLQGRAGGKARPDPRRELAQVEHLPEALAVGPAADAPAQRRKPVPMIIARSSLPGPATTLSAR